MEKYFSSDTLPKIARKTRFCRTHALKLLKILCFRGFSVISQGLKEPQKIHFLRFRNLHTRMTVNQAKYRRKDHLALTTTCLQSSAFQGNFLWFGGDFFEQIWAALEIPFRWRSGCIQFSFERIDEILGFPIDHSFLHYKLEAEKYGYRVEKISLKEKWVRFVRIAAQWHHTFANPLAFLYTGSYCRVQRLHCLLHRSWKFLSKRPSYHWASWQSSQVLCWDYHKYNTFWLNLQVFGWKTAAPESAAEKLLFFQCRLIVNVFSLIIVLTI